MCVGMHACIHACMHAIRHLLYIQIQNRYHKKNIHRCIHSHIRLHNVLYTLTQCHTRVLVVTHLPCTRPGPRHIRPCSRRCRHTSTSWGCTCQSSCTGTECPPDSGYLEQDSLHIPFHFVHEKRKYVVYKQLQSS